MTIRFKFLKIITVQFSYFSYLHLFELKLNTLIYSLDSRNVLKSLQLECDKNSEHRLYFTINKSGSCVAFNTGTLD